LRHSGNDLCQPYDVAHFVDGPLRIVVAVFDPHADTAGYPWVDAVEQCADFEINVDSQLTSRLTVISPALTPCSKHPVYGQ
jgi:hypothetical protein